MKWFNSENKRLAMIQGMNPTSKATLKLQCLMVCKGDIDEASKLYDFFVKDMQTLPDIDPKPTTWVDNTKEMANGLMGWLKDNQNTLVQAYSFFQQLIANRGALPTLVTDIEETAEPLPEIN